MKQLTPQAKAVIRLISLVYFANSLAGIFVNIFLWKQTENFTTLVIYNFYSFVFLLLVYVFSGYWLKKYSARTLIKLGILTAILFYAAIIFLQDKSIQFLVPLGILNGISGGLFWSGFNLHQYLSTYKQNRDYFFGTQEFWSNLARITGPILGGLIVTLFGYYYLFAITAVILCLAIRDTWSFPRFSGVDFRLHQIVAVLKINPAFKSVLFQQMFWGLRDVSLGTIITILTFLILGHEFNVGMYNSAIGLLTAIAGFAVGKLLTPANRIKFALVGALSYSLSSVILFLLPNLTGLISFSLLGIPGLFLTISLGTLFYTVADMDSQAWRFKYAYLVNRDLALGLSRILSYVILWRLFLTLPQSTAISYWLIFTSFLPLLIFYAIKHQPKFN